MLEKTAAEVETMTMTASTTCTERRDGERAAVQE
jgi:hypothetical protein